MASFLQIFQAKNLCEICIVCWRRSLQRSTTRNLNDKSFFGEFHTVSDSFCGVCQAGNTLCIALFCGLPRQRTRTTMPASCCPLSLSPYHLSLSLLYASTILANELDKSRVSSVAPREAGSQANRQNPFVSGEWGS